MLRLKNSNSALVCAVLTVSAALYAQTAVAQNSAQAEAFNTAWELHKSIRSGSDVAAKLDTAREVLEIGQAFLPESDERLAMLMHNYGTILFQAGRNYEAHDVLLDALQLLEQIHGKHSLELLETIKAAADAWGGHPGFARRHYSGYKRALGIVARHHGKDSLEYADLSMETGARLYDLSRSDIGDRRIRDALEFYESALPSPDIRSGAAAFYLGKIRLGKGNTRAAMAYLERSLPHFQGDSEVQRINRLRSMALLVQAHNTKRELDKVDEYAERIGREMQFATNQDLVPLITVNPAYPEQFRERGIEGYVVVEFSIDQQGHVINPVAVESDNRFSTKSEVGSRGIPRPGDTPGAAYESLEDAAIEAVSQYRYAPRYVDNKAVVVRGVSVHVVFEKKR